MDITFEQPFSVGGITATSTASCGIITVDEDGGVSSPPNIPFGIVGVAGIFTLVILLVALYVMGD